MPHSFEQRNSFALGKIYHCKFSADLHAQKFLIHDNYAPKREWVQLS